MHFISLFAFLALVVTSQTALADNSKPGMSKPSLKTATPVTKTSDSVKAAAAANARTKVDSIKAAAANAAKKSVDSAKAASEMAAKKTADSAKAMAKAKADSAKAAAVKVADSAKAAADAALKKTKKDSVKPAPAPAKAEVVEAVPEPKAPPAPAGCGVAKIVFGTGIENREPQGEASEFEAGTERVHAWTRLACGSGPIQVQHVWYTEGPQTQDVALSCQSASGRVWSNAPVSAGKWKVEVLKETGESMGSGEFTVK
jgi:hypothetical protein